jgi:hypothetical protein
VTGGHPLDLYFVLAFGWITFGYWIGRVRPLERLKDWTVWQLRRGHITTKPRALAWIVLHSTLFPIATWRTWRRRNDPPRRGKPIRLLTPEEREARRQARAAAAERPPAPKLNPNWPEHEGGRS